MNGETMQVGKWTIRHGWMNIAVTFCVISLASASNGGCGEQCSCTALAVLCHGCPDSFPPLAVSDDTEHLLVDGCDKPFDNYAARAIPPKNILKLSIVNSALADVKNIALLIDSVESLILQNNSIRTINFTTLSSNMTFLDLSLNNIISIQNKTFTNLPNLKYLDLSKNEVNQMTKKCFVGLNKLQHLDLSLNNLTILSNVFLPLISLQHLNLSWNHIELLPEGCFSSLYMLQHLDVSYNRLTSVAPGALQFLPNLARLLLADNPNLGINQLDGQLLVGTGRRLQQVDASRTGLVQVPEALTHSVRFLTLAGNKISTIRCGDVDSYPLLQILDFTDNVMNAIEDDALGRLELLSKLYLNNNNLKAVPKMLPGELTELSMNHNLIGNLTSTDFTNLSNLKILLLASNDIYFIQENVFIQLIALQVLDLSYNPIKSLSTSTLNGPSALRELNLSYLNISMPATDVSFPVSTPEGLEKLELRNSSGLANQLLSDTAVLAALTRLQYLDIRFTNMNNLRTDLVYYLSQLRILKLEGNPLNCNELNWLANWVKDNPTNEKILSCIYPIITQHALTNHTNDISIKESSTIQSIIEPEEKIREQFKINKINKKFQRKNYNKFNILRDVSQRRESINMNEKNIADRTLQIHRSTASIKTNNNETDKGKTIIKAIKPDQGNLRRLVDFFSASNKTGSAGDMSEVGNKTIISKDAEVGETTIGGEKTPADATRSEITSEGFVSGGGATSREPQPLSLSAREANATAAGRQRPTDASESLSVDSYGVYENKNHTECKVLTNTTMEPNAKISLLKNFKLDRQAYKKNESDITNINIINKQKKKKFLNKPIIKSNLISSENQTNAYKEKETESKTLTPEVGVSHVLKIIDPNTSTEIPLLVNQSIKPLRSNNESRGEWSMYSAERSRSHQGALVALGAVGLCVAAWALIYAWGRRRMRKSQQRAQPDHEDIEVSSVAAAGGLW